MCTKDLQEYNSILAFLFVNVVIRGRIREDGQYLRPTTSAQLHSQAHIQMLDKNKSLIAEQILLFTTDLILFQASRQILSFARVPGRVINLKAPEQSRQRSIFGLF